MLKKEQSHHGVILLLQPITYNDCGFRLFVYWVSSTQGSSFAANKL